MNDYHNWTEADYLYGGKYMYQKPPRQFTIFHLMLFWCIAMVMMGGGAFGWAYFTHHIQDLKAQAAQCQAK